MAFVNFIISNRMIFAYTVYINTEEVYSENLANNIENDLLDLVDKETLLRISKHDTNPENNPQPPSKYH